MTHPRTASPPLAGRTTRRVSVLVAGALLAVVAAVPAFAATPTTPTTKPTSTSTKPTITKPPPSTTTSSTLVSVPVAVPTPGSTLPPYTVVPVADLKAPTLTPGLDQLKVTSPDIDAASGRITQLQTELADAKATRASAGLALVSLGRRDRALSAKLRDARSRKRLASHRLAVLHDAIEQIAVANFVGGNSSGGASIGFNLDLNGDAQMGKKQVMVGIVNSDKLNRLHQTELAFDKARTEITITTAVQTGVRNTIRDTTARRDAAASAGSEYGRQLILAVAALDSARRLAVVDVVNLPVVVLDAYVKAANTTAITEPACGIPWWALAGIGLTESHQGTSGGATVRIDGSLSQPIFGIPLNGSHSTAVIGGVNGPDRAQGPMQFITSTWKLWGRDGNADGVVDIQNFYDAAVSAAAYLCAGGPMNTIAGLERGYFSYNHSVTYVAQVLSQAVAYGRALTLPTASIVGPQLTPPPATPGGP